MTDDRSEMEATRLAGLEQRHEQRLARATYTAAEVKVLTEAAGKFGYELGRSEVLAERCGCLLGTRHSIGDHLGLGPPSRGSGAVSDERSGGSE